MKNQNSPADEFSNSPFIKIIQMAASVIVFALGLVVLIGWYSRVPILIQVLPTFVPMQFNTALGFLLCGIALFLAARSYKKPVIVLGVVIFTLGSLTLLQYIFDINLGIDELFMRHYIGVKTSHPGRMAPNTALCFTLSSIALIIYFFKFRYALLLSSLIGAIIAGLGFVSFFGYLIDIPTAYSWGQLTAMAVHTSLGFIFIGVVVILLTRDSLIKDKFGQLLYLPMLVAVSGLTITVCLWQAVYYQERSTVEAATRIEANNLRNATIAELNKGVFALERMANRWTTRNGIPKDEWESDAKLYVRDFSYYQAVERVDSDFKVQWVEPLKGNEKALGLNVASEERRRNALEKARDNKTSVVTRPIELIQGGKGILICSPIFTNDEFDGFIIGVLKIEELFQSVLPDEFESDYSVVIYNEEEEVFENGVALENAEDPFEIGVKVENSIETYGVKWKTVVSPKRNLSFFSGFSLDDLALLLGLLITALLAWMLYLYQRSQLDSQAKAAANVDLVKEVKERNRIERALRETSALREAILDSANYMIISTDVDGTISAFNKTAEKLLGYKAEEVVGKYSPEIIHIEEEVVEYAKELTEKEGYEFNPGFQTFVAKAKHNIVDEREWTYVHKDGTQFPIILSVNALRDEEGEITGYLGIGKDISDLKKINQELLQSEQRFETFMNNSPAVAFIRDDQQRYTFVNKQFEKRFRVDAKQLLGNTDSVWLSKDKVEQTLQTDLEVIEERKVIESIETVKKQDGQKDYWLLIKFPIENHDGSVYVGGVALDISESKRLETELKDARDAALDSVRLKSEFLANMSHEIRTPMNGVMGMTEILLDTALDEEQLDYTQTIQESAESLLRIINDILDFSKIEAGKIIFETIDFNLRSVVESVTAMFAEEVERKGLEIASLVETDVPTKLQGDPGRLKQILINLIGNAIKFTTKGSIYVKACKISETETHTKLQFAISDTGIGMKDDIQKYLFQAFVQADGSMTRKYGGTGLGLAISKQLVEIMGGEISVDSEFGKGSTFTFTARFEKQTISEGQEIVPIKDLTNLRALIVDDNATNREIIAYQISSWGMLPSEAEDAGKALKLLRQGVEFDRPFDLVFLDLMMPDVSGFELAELIKDDESIKDIKMILMPSFGKRGHSEDAEKVGIDGYLIKPIRQADLYDCIATVMGKKKRGKTERSSSERLITHHTLDDKRLAKEVRILIAEDNLVNQKVSRSQIDRLGYKSDVVSNGLEVIDAISKKNYSLILMDCQMPEMDGYEATYAIREREKDGEHIPIVAVTANALLGEQEKCLAAGMDEYLAKPFKQHELKAAIERCLSKSEYSRMILRKSGSDTKQHRISARYEFLPDISDRLTELKSEVGEEMVGMILSLFIEDSFMRIKQIHKHIKMNNVEMIASEAHSLKGSSANIGANHVSEMCADLEANVMDFTETEIRESFAEIESSFLELFEAIEIVQSDESENLVET